MASNAENVSIWWRLHGVMIKASPDQAQLMINVRLWKSPGGLQWENNEDKNKNKKKDNINNKNKTKQKRHVTLKCKKTTIKHSYLVSLRIIQHPERHHPVLGVPRRQCLPGCDGTLFIVNIGLAWQTFVCGKGEIASTQLSCGIAVS